MLSEEIKGLKREQQRRKRRQGRSNVMEDEEEDRSSTADEDSQEMKNKSNLYIKTANTMFLPNSNFF